MPFAGGLSLRRSLALLTCVVVIALAGAAAALAPGSSGQSPGTTAPPCKPAGTSPSLPLAQGITVYATPNPLTAGGPVRVFGALAGVRRGVKRCGVEVVLWRRLPTQRGFTVVARTRTIATPQRLTPCRTPVSAPNTRTGPPAVSGFGVA